MMYVGIDCGVNGAIAVIQGNKIEIWDYKDSALLSLLEVIKKNKVNHLIMIEDGHDAVHVTNRRFYNPKNVYQQGFNTGYVVGMCYGCNVNTKLVGPKVWKKKLNLMGGTKEDTAEFMGKLFPDQKYIMYGLRGGLKDGRSDALAIAYFGKVTNDCG